MFDLNSGELFVVLFISIAIVSASIWPKLGEWIVTRFAGRENARDEVDSP